jgi:Tol biopolymer transport system component
MLEPSPSDRYPTAAEALADLKAFQDSLSVARNTRRTLAWSVAAALVAVVLATGVWLSRREEPSVQGTFTRLTDQEGREEYPSLSPDGTSFVYVRTVEGQRDLYWQRVEGGSPILLTPNSPLDDTQPAFSPDEHSIAFRSERGGGGIYLVAPTGGAVRRIADFGFNPAWSPDGKEIAVATESVTDPTRRGLGSQIWRFNVESGRKQLIVEGDGVQPNWSFQGRRIAYWGLSSSRTRRILWTVPAEGGNPVAALDDRFFNWNPVWSQDGRHLYFGSDRDGNLNLWRLPIDEQSGNPLGEPRLVPTPAQASGFWSISRDGRRIVYAANESKSNIVSFPFDPGEALINGPEVPVTRGSQAAQSCDVSQDGRWIAFHAGLPQEDLFLVRADGSGLRRLTKDRHKDRQPFWSPDGKWLLFYSNRGGTYQGWIIRPDGKGLQPILRGRREPLTFPIWAPDGRRVACLLGEVPVVIDLAQPFQQRIAMPLLPSNASESFAPTSWSSDGEWLAGNLYPFDSVGDGIGLFSFRSGTYKRLTSRGSNPVWLRDGKKLLYMDRGAVLSFDLRTRETRSVLSPEPTSLFTSLSLSSDQHHLYTVRKMEEGDVWLLTTK